MKLRAATVDDLASLADFGQRVLFHTYLRTGLLAEDEVAEMLDWWTEDYFAEALEHPHILLLTEDGGEITAVAQTEIVPPALAVTWKLYVDPTRQGSGHGSALMSATSAALPEPITVWQTEYLSTNEPAARFYRSRGFVYERDQRYGERTYVWVGQRISRCAKPPAASPKSSSGVLMRPSP
jgi:ribosomal protein S18 acetylase RimI-like enzyme